MDPTPASQASKRPLGQPARHEINQEEFRKCLRDVDKFLHDRRFQDAKSRLEDAKAIDPSNPYVVAFVDRIKLFEEEPDKPFPAPAASSVPAPAPAKPPSVKQPEPRQHHPPSREVLEQNLRLQIETEYKQKFMHQLQQAEAAAAKKLEEERTELERQKQLLKSQFDRQLEESRKRIEAEYQKRTEEAVTAADRRLKTQVQHDQASIEQELKTSLASHYEQKIRELEESLKKEQAVLLEQERASSKAREQQMREEFGRKMLDALRKSETLFRQQSRQEIELEQQKLRAKLAAEFEATLKREQETIRREFENQKKQLEHSFEQEQHKLRQKGKSEVEVQVEELRKKELKSFESQRAVMRAEIESEFARKLETELAAERERLHAEAENAVAREKDRLKTEFEAMAAGQRQNIQQVRQEIQSEMEKHVVHRFEQVAAEFDKKMDLLGTKIPQSTEERTAYYRDRMMECYTNGRPSANDARRLMELKELLELTFDDHLAIESDVRVELYAAELERRIVGGDLNMRETACLDQLKQKFNISPEEATRLEPYMLASFERHAVKGRILLLDDEATILESVGQILRDVGYQVHTLLDIKGGLDLLNTSPVDLILCDIKFPGDDFAGFAFYKSVQTQPDLRQIPFIFMSSLRDGVIVRSGMQLGADDYLMKPVDPEFLIAVIEGKLKRFRGMQQRSSGPQINRRT